VETDTNSFSQDYALNLLPHPLLPIILGINIENYHNQNNHPLSASRINLQTENQTLTAGLTWSPDVKFSFRSDYNLKITKIVQDLSLTPQSRQKTLFDNNVSYKIADWGTVSYDRLDEINGGEIQAGAIADLNLQKVTETLSLNVNLPVNNPVLSSFVFVASIKSVDYKNLKNTSEDFKAALTTFEGTLNF
jgi:hypothetical protein